MATTTVTKVYEYDNEGRVVREISTTETVGPYATGGVISTIASPSQVNPQAILDALLRLKRERGGDLGLS